MGGGHTGPRRRKRTRAGLGGPVPYFAWAVVLIVPVVFVSLLGQETSLQFDSTPPLVTPSVDSFPPATSSPPFQTSSSGFTAGNLGSEIERALEAAMDEALTEGRLVFNPPDEMGLHETVLVEVRLTSEPTDLLSDRELVRSLEGAGTPMLEPALVAPLMTVRLHGSGFEITPLSSSEQVVVEGFTEWEFDVTPVESGELTLSLTASARLVVDELEADARIDVPTIRRSVTVDVSPLQAMGLWWQGNWSWAVALSVLLVATAGLVGRAVRRTRRQPKDATLDAQLFISYRRRDAPGSTGRLHDRLAEHVGSDHVFMDVEDISPGEDFVATIHRQIAASDTLLVVIGPHWAESLARSGVGAPGEPDFVQVEIEAATTHAVPVVPVLVDGAEPPTAGDLPDGCRHLAVLQAARLSAETFQRDVDDLIDRLRELEVHV